MIRILFIILTSLATVNLQAQVKLLSYTKLPDAAQREQMELAGVEFLRFYPGKGYAVRLASKDVEIQQTEAWDVQFANVPVELKLHPQLAAGSFRIDCRAGEQVEVLVTLYPGVEKAQAQALGYEVIDYGYAQIVGVVLPVDSLQALANNDMVEFVGHCFNEPQPDNQFGRASHRSNVLKSAFNGLGMIDGTGVNVMMQDDGEIGPHIDVKGRIDQGSSLTSQGNHGDHVAGTIMGAGNLDPLAEGMASGAFLYVYRAAPNYNGFGNMADAYNLEQVRITSTSYSDGCNDGYTGFTQIMDQQSNVYPSLLHVFSAGNSGSSDCGYGAGAGWGNITGGHKAGKNVIAVANLTATDGLAGSSSRGPAHDGRIKPDVGAVGTNVFSTIAGNSYANFSGTSMACPGTSGVLAQLYQVWNSIHGQDPPGPVMKAVLMNTADDLGNPGPDFRYGFGRINAKRAMDVIMNDLVFYDTLNQAEQHAHSFTVPSGISELKMMLYWHDVEAAAGATIALVNDLDMVMVSPSGDTVRPLVLDPTPTNAALNATAIPGEDHLNNVEQIVIQMPDAGLWELVITGHQVPFGPQAAVVTWDIKNESIHITYPSGGEGFVPMENELIRWDAPDDTTSFSLSYSADDGLTWSPVATLSGANRLYSWWVPDTVSGQVRLKLERGPVVFQTERFSIIRVPQNLNVEYACEDSSLLVWDPVNGATSYQVFRLGSRYMEPVDTVLDTMYTFQGTALFGDEWFSVTALGALDASGRRAVAVQKPVGFFECPLLFDARLEQVIVPAYGTILSCHDWSDLRVKIILMNNGTDTLSNIPVNYRINSGTIRSAIYAPNLLPGDAVEYEFPFTEDMSATGIYFTEAWVSYTGDENNFNDTATSYTHYINGSTYQPPVSQDFEQDGTCPTFASCGFHSCSLINGWVNVQNGGLDQIDWRVNAGSTPTANTGPDEDVLPGTSAGHYSYIEVTNCANREAILLSPCIDLTSAQNPELTYSIHMFGGPDMGELYVDLFDGERWFENIAPPQLGNIGIFWINKSVDLSNFVGKTVNIRFRATTGTEDRGDIALDAIRIGEPLSTSEQTLPALRVYPNPVNNALMMDIPQQANYQIIDASGRVVEQGATMGTIDVQHLAEGMYTITLTFGENNLQQQFVKVAR